jgi:hypothetical protein
MVVDWVPIVEAREVLEFYKRIVAVMEEHLHPEVLVCQRLPLPQLNMVVQAGVVEDQFPLHREHFSPEALAEDQMF